MTNLRLIRLLPAFGVVIASLAAFPAAAQKGHNKHGGESGHCPPGQAKKGNCEPGEAFVPPGQAKKWAKGQPLPQHVHYYALPPARYSNWGAPPSGYEYVQVDDDVLLIERATRIVINLMVGR
jgi:Ni/Co efflux regulator RcnB